MSQRALLLATRNYLRSTVPFPDDECEVMYDGQPPPMAGERFVSIWAGDWTGSYLEGLDEMMGVNITVTRRIAFAPIDRVVNPLTSEDAKALDVTLRAILAAMHLDRQADSVLNAANTLIGPNYNGFVEPPQFRNGGRPEPKGPEWFTAEGTDVVGIAQTLIFGGCRRVQTIESAA